MYSRDDRLISENYEKKILSDPQPDLLKTHPSSPGPAQLGGNRVTFHRLKHYLNTQRGLGKEPAESLELAAKFFGVKFDELMTILIDDRHTVPRGPEPEGPTKPSRGRKWKEGHAKDAVTKPYAGKVPTFPNQEKKASFKGRDTEDVDPEEIRKAADALAAEEEDFAPSGFTMPSKQMKKFYPYGN